MTSKSNRKKKNSKPTQQNQAEIDSLNPMFPFMSSPNQFMDPTLDCFSIRRRGSSSNASWSGSNNRLFDFQTITPLSIPQQQLQSNASAAAMRTMDTDRELSKSMHTASSVSSIDLMNCNAQDFVRSAPLRRGHSIGSMQDDQSMMDWNAVPTLLMPEMNQINDDDDNVLDMDMMMNELPDFVKSSFFADEPSSERILRRASIEDHQSLADPNKSAPQSAPATQFDGFSFMPAVFSRPDTNDWNGMVNNAFNKSTEPFIVSQNDIFPNGSNSEMDRGRSRNQSNWSNLTTESENEPIMNLVQKGMNLNDLHRRKRARSVSDGDKQMPPTQKLKKSLPMKKELPSSIKQEKNAMNMPRKRGRPRKYPKSATLRSSVNDIVRSSKSKYVGLKKSERERLRRKELKDGYTRLKNLLDLKVKRGGAALPDRSAILEAACQEIQALEDKLFGLSENM